VIVLSQCLSTSFVIPICIERHSPPQQFPLPVNADKKHRKHQKYGIVHVVCNYIAFKFRGVFSSDVLFELHHTQTHRKRPAPCHLISTNLRRASSPHHQIPLTPGTQPMSASLEAAQLSAVAKTRYIIARLPSIAPLVFAITGNHA
jgi:hypothetical protein